MKKNIGVLDKILRIFFLTVIGILFYLDLIEGELITYILMFVSGIFLITSLLDFCPLYLVFDITTKRRESDANV